MKEMVLAACLLSLAGCTISIVDERVSREEVAQAFQERDALIIALAKAVKELQPKKAEAPSKK